MGPVISEVQCNMIMDYISKGKKTAKLITGGKRLERKGFFIEPTLFGDCTQDMEIVKDEIFGPVISTLRFNELDEAIDIANNSNYGLVGGVVTTDMKKAQ